MNKQKIDENFIDDLRLNLAITTWIFDETEENEIVPKELTHDYLLSNFNIDESIYKYYHLPTSKFLSDREFQKMKDNGFVGKKEKALRPYSNIIYGAYYSRSDLETKLTMLIYSERDYTIEGKKIKYLVDLIPYFKEYAKGFKNGFNEFDNTQIKPFFPLLADKQDYVNKVFEFVTKRILFTQNWANPLEGFTTNFNNEIVNAFENGQKQGCFYRAWSIIFSNQNLFAPLFQEYFTTLPPQPKDKNDSKTKDIILDIFNSIDAKGWQYAFENEEDFNIFTSLLTKFFEYESYKLPKEIIRLKKNCKTKIAMALGNIHKELSNKDKLKTDTEFFKLIRVLSPFEKTKENDLYKALTR